MAQFKHLGPRQDVWGDVKAFVTCSLAVVALVVGAFSLVYFKQVLSIHTLANDKAGYVNTEHYVSTFEP